MSGLYFWMMIVGALGSAGFAICVFGAFIEYWNRKPQKAVVLAVVCLILSAGFALMAGVGNELSGSRVKMNL